VTPEDDRAHPYREWRRTIGRSLYVNDVDQFEWRMVDGVVRPVGLLELTRVNGNAPVGDKYLGAILARMRKRDPQERVACEIARRCGVCAFVVLWRWDLSEFWVYNLSDSIGWWQATEPQYRDFLTRLRPPE